MTHVVGGRRRRRPARGWLLPLSGLVGILVASAGGLVSRAIVIDFLAWWPVWVLLGLMTYLARNVTWARVRVAGLIPLAALLALAVFMYAYFAGWPVMPSASLQLVGPEASTAEVAALSARIDGAIEVAAGSSGFLYEARPLRGGGDTPFAEAVERTQGTAFSVALQPVSDPGLYTYEGWELRLSNETTWSLTLEGGVEGDLTSLSISELKLLGDGHVSLGTTQSATPVTIEGSFQLTIPSGAPVRVIGEAQVPSDWRQQADGWVTPSDGDGWVVSVGPGATLVIVNP